MSKVISSFAAPAAFAAFAVFQAPAAASTCATCTASDPIEGLSLTAKPFVSQLGGWKFRSRLQDAGSTGDLRRLERISSLTSGGDASEVTMVVERYFSARRKPIEQINLPSDRQRRSRMELGYSLRTSDADRLGLSLNGAVERRRLGFAALRGKWANTRSLGISANWTHDEQWRLSAGYSIDQSHNARTGIRRSIQLAAGAPPSASEMAVAVDYSPSFINPDRLRIGIEARQDHMTWADSTALGMRDRDAKRLSLRARMAL